MGMWWLNVVLDLFSVNPKYSKDKFHFWLGKSSKVFMRGFGSTSHLIYMYRWTNLISVWYLLSFDILLISMWFAIPGDFYHHSKMTHTRLVFIRFHTRSKVSTKFPSPVVYHYLSIIRGSFTWGQRSTVNVLWSSRRPYYRRILCWLTTLFYKWCKIVP